MQVQKNSGQRNSCGKHEVQGTFANHDQFWITLFAGILVQTLRPHDNFFYWR